MTHVRTKAPNGDGIVIVPEADYDRMIEELEDLRDSLIARRVLREIESGEEEMGIQYMRCSGSNVLITGNDAAAAVMLANGSLVSVGPYIVTQGNVLPLIVDSTMKSLGPGEVIEDGEAVAASAVPNERNQGRSVRPKCIMIWGTRPCDPFGRDPRPMFNVYRLARHRRTSAGNLFQETWQTIDCYQRG